MEMTLPLIHALSLAPKDEKSKIINYIKNDSKNEAKIKEVIQFVKKYDGLVYATQVMNRFQSEALEILQTMPTSEASQSLIDLIQYVTTRRN
jgi:octaprenyl-diphosphate synthase